MSAQVDAQLAPTKGEAEEPVPMFAETTETQLVPNSLLDVSTAPEFPVEEERTATSKIRSEGLARTEAQVHPSIVPAAKKGTYVAEVEVTQDMLLADACDTGFAAATVLHEPEATKGGTSSVAAASEPAIHAKAALESGNTGNDLFEFGVERASEATITAAAEAAQSQETSVIAEPFPPHDTSIHMTQELDLDSAPPPGQTMTFQAAGMDTGVSPEEAFEPGDKSEETSDVQAPTPQGNMQVGKEDEGARASKGTLEEKEEIEVPAPTPEQGFESGDKPEERSEVPAPTPEGNTEETRKEDEEKDCEREESSSDAAVEGVTEENAKETHQTTPMKSALLRDADREFWGTPPTATPKHLNNSVELFEGEGISRAGLAAPWKERPVPPRRQRWLCCIVDDESKAVSDGDVETFEDEVEAWQVAWIRQGLEDIERATIARVRREVFAAWLDVVHPGATLRAAGIRHKATALRAGLQAAPPPPLAEEPKVREATTQTRVEATTQTCVEERGHTQQSQVREHTWLDAGTLKRADAQQGTVTGEYWRSKGAFDDAASTAASSFADQSAINWTPGTGGSLGSIAPGSSLRSVTPGGSIRGIAPGSCRPPLVPSTSSSATSNFGRSRSVGVLEERDTRIEVPVHIVPKIVEAAAPTSDACLIVPKIVEVPVTVEVCEPRQPRQTMEVRKICHPTYMRSVTLSSCTPMGSVVAPPAHARGPPPQGCCLRVLPGMSAHHRPMQAMA